MKKLSSIGLIILFSCALTACDNKSTAVTKTANNTAQTKSEVVLDETAQFKKDYEAIIKWNNIETQKIQEQIAIIQKRIVEQQDPTKKLTTEEATTLVTNLKNTIAQSINELDALNIKDPDLQELTNKMKQGNNLAQESFEISITASSKPAEETPKYRAEFEAKMKELQALNTEVGELNRKVGEKYRSLHSK
ncbi:Uncharacterised protein [Pasteurella multocida]|uniref:Lipoprotein n=1 Tax=Pasteurella dagmatis ATCC 43325 TaxID=667128 RepID=C9PS42_9PAST|nr:hypothetical protein [Pasteurella dagmatis]EEX49769.1 hypothetical protein HMPREF0621_1816 [Pasteurella dagmatis ATCC 43325]SNV71116.1 Uncharacterised protein [Pasteurella dagmatis]VEI57264.1 Uncharacterised protein [Pasteurella multocida]